ADGSVVAEDQVVGDQDSPFNLKLRCEDRAAAGRADVGEVGAAPRVAAARPGLVVVERAVRDRGHSAIQQSPAEGGADEALAGAAAGGVGAPEGLIVREHTPG